MPTLTHCAIYPCARHLDDSIAHLTRTYLSPEHLQAYLAQALNEPFADLLRPTPIGAADRMAKLLDSLADELGATGALIFQQAVFSIQTQRVHAAKHPLTALDSLDRQLKRLCLVWAYGKQQMPEAPFFKSSLTASLTARLKTIWQQPAMQATLRHTTEQLRQNSPYGEWIARYPTCWAYTFGALMHQLLQWNHQLTPAALGESWRIETTAHRDDCP